MVLYLIYIKGSLVVDRREAVQMTRGEEADKVRPLNGMRTNTSRSRFESPLQ